MKNITTLIVSFLLVYSANAAQYAFKNLGPASAYDALGIVSSGGTALGSSATAQLGYFSDEAQAATGVFTSWNQFGSDVNFAGSGVFSTDGLFSGDVSGAVNAGSSFIDESISILITNGAGNEFLAATTSFTFAVDDPLTTGDVFLYDTTLTYLFGGTADTGFSIDGLGARSAVQTAPVPEPSTYALLGGLLALCCVMVRRRA